MVSFGQKEKFSDNDGDIWIKGFKDGDSVWRFLEEPPDWHKYFEHYDPETTLIGNKKPGAFFGCALRSLGSCKGCEHPAERVAKAGVKWAVNALDAGGKLQLLKVGAQIKKPMVNRQQRLNTIVDRDFVVNRSGSGLETEYVTDPQERSERTHEGALHDAGEIIAKTYFDWLRAYEAGEHEVVEETYEGEAEVAPAPAAKEPVKAKAKAAPKATPKAEQIDGPTAAEQLVSPVVSEEEAAAPAPWEEASSTEGVDPKLWKTADLRAYLDGEGIDYGKAPRSRLVAMVTTQQG